MYKHAGFDFFSLIGKKTDLPIWISTKDHKLVYFNEAFGTEFQVTLSKLHSDLCHVLTNRLSENLAANIIKEANGLINSGIETMELSSSGLSKPTEPGENPQVNVNIKKIATLSGVFIYGQINSPKDEQLFPPTSKMETAQQSNHNQIKTSSLILNEIPAAVCIIHPENYTFYWANFQFYNLLGLDKNDINKTSKNVFFQLLKKSELKPLLKSIQALKEGTKDTIERVIHLTSLSGNSITVNANIRTSIIDGQPILLATLQDVTDYEIQTKDLKENQNFTNEVFLRLPILIYILDLNEKKVLWLNKHPGNEDGVPMEYFIENTISEFKSDLHPIDQEKYHLIFSKLFTLKEDEIFETEYRYLAGEKKYKWYNTQFSPFKFENDRPTQIIAIRNEITEKKRAETIAQEYVLKLNTLIQTVHEGLALVNEKGVFEIYNFQMIQITGYTKNEAGTFQHFITQLLPEYKSFLAENPSIDEFFNSSLLKNEEYEIINKDGTLKKILLSTTSFKFGKQKYYLFTFKDITDYYFTQLALKDSEKRYRIIAENSTDVIWIANLKFETVYISNSIKNFCGITPTERMQMKLEEKFTSRSINKMRSIASKMMETSGHNRTLPPFELEYIHKNGSIVLGEAIVTPLTDNKNNVTGFLGITRDITKRKEYEKNLIESKKRLKELNATKDKFFSIITHGLINPFNALIGFSEMLLKRYDEIPAEERTDYIRRINMQAKNGFFLLQNMLDWSKSQSEGLTAFTEIVNLSQLIGREMVIFKEAANLKNIHLEINMHSNILVYADKNMLKTIMSNLIFNAIKFTNQGGFIQVQTRPEEHTVIIDVEDSGIGMSEEQCRKLFRKDINFSRPGTANEKGSGLGLLICKEFVEQNGGEIWVKSKVDEGSTFSFSLKRFKKSV